MSGRGSNGKKLWIQTYVNIEKGEYLTNLIKNQDSSISNITWLSPLSKDNYRQYNTLEILDYLKEKNIKVNLDDGFIDILKDFNVTWDAIGIDDNDLLVLIKANANVYDTKNNYCLNNDRDLNNIIKEMEETCDKIAGFNSFNKRYWCDSYYEIGSMITIYNKLNESNISTRFIILNFVDDPTLIATSFNEWSIYFQNLFNHLIKTNVLPKGMNILNLKV